MATGGRGKSNFRESARGFGRASTEANAPSLRCFCVEVARLVADGHMNVGMSIDRFVHEATRHGGLRLLPLSTQILIESTRLPGTIHRNLSDRLLIATGREHGLTLITRDKELLDYAKQGHLNARRP